MKCNYCIWILVCIAFMVFTNCSTKKRENNAADPWISRVDSLFTAMEKNNEGFGSITITKDGNRIYSRATGYSNVENKIKSTSETKYRIGSVSKTFTSVLAFKALEEGKIGLDQTLDAYFPMITNSSEITISQLLYHQSGIPEYTIDPVFFDTYTQARSRQEMIEIIQGHGSDFKPGSQTAYSNTNYLLISYILEDLYKKAYKNILKEIIIDPLELKNTYMGETDKVNDDESFSYEYTGILSRQDEVEPSLYLGAGAIVSTPSDVCLFINALFSGKLINDSSLKQMTTLNNGDIKMGMGIAEVPFSNRQTIFLGHAGLTDMFRAGYIYSREDEVCIAYCLNAVHDEEEHGNMNDFMLEKLISMYESN